MKVNIIFEYNDNNNKHQQYNNFGKRVIGSNICDIEVWIVYSLWIVFLKLHDVLASQAETSRSLKTRSKVSKQFTLQYNNSFSNIYNIQWFFTETKIK